MIDLVYVVLALAVAGASGAVLLRATAAEPDDDRDRLLCMVAVGLGAWGLIGLALAAAQVLRASVILAIGVAALLSGGRDLAGVLGAVLRRARRWPRPVLAVTTGTTLIVMLITVLAPAVTGDQTKYQLAYPKLYAEAGGLVATPWSFWGQQQFLQNFLFAVAYAVRGERLALLLNASWIVLAAAALARLVDRHLWRGAGGSAAALLVTMPMAWSLTTKAGADLALVAYTTLGMTALLDWRSAGDGASLRRAALAGGLAGGTKVMGLLTPALLGAGIVIGAPSGRRGPAVRLRAATTFGLLGLVLAAPPYVRNAFETGNPLHPFAASIFPTKHWSPEANAYLEEYYRQYRAERAVRREGAPYRGWEVLRFPWDLTMAPESFERAARQSLDTGPFVLAFLPAAIALAWRRRRAAWILGVGVTYVAIIALGAWAHPRYVLPGIVLVLAVGVAGARAISGRWFGAIVAVTLLGQLVVTSRLALPGLAERARAAVGVRSRAEYLEAQSDRYRFWRRACPVIGTAGSVMVLEKIPHPYFIACRFVLASYLEQQLVDYRALTSVAALDAAARGLGVTYVAVALPDLARRADPYETRVTELWRDWIQTLGRPVLEQPPYALYALPPAGSGAP